MIVENLQREENPENKEMDERESMHVNGLERERGKGKKVL